MLGVITTPAWPRPGNRMLVVRDSRTLSKDHHLNNPYISQCSCSTDIDADFVHKQIACKTTSALRPHHAVDGRIIEVPLHIVSEKIVR